MKTLVGVLVLVLLALSITYFLKGNTRQTADSTQKEDTTGAVQGGTTLDLSNQGLTKVPESVFKNTDLVELDLSHNALTGALQSQVGQLKNLKVLNLSGNRFTGVPAEVGALVNLEVLDLSNNELTGLPNELGNLSKLKLLDVSGNTYSPADLAGIKANLPASTVIKTQ